MTRPPPALACPLSSRIVVGCVRFAPSPRVCQRSTGEPRGRHRKVFSIGWSFSVTHVKFGERTGSKAPFGDVTFLRFIVDPSSLKSSGIVTTAVHLLLAAMPPYTILPVSLNCIANTIIINHIQTPQSPLSSVVVTHTLRGVLPDLFFIDRSRRLTDPGTKPADEVRRYRNGYKPWRKHNTLLSQTNKRRSSETCPGTRPKSCLRFVIRILSNRRVAPRAN